MICAYYATHTSVRRVERFKRRALALVQRRLAAARAVVLNGPRQSGKTELLHVVEADVGGTYLSLDRRELVAQARLDPYGFLADHPRPLLIDEVQRGGDQLLLALKLELDTSPAKGRAVLAGSTRFLTEPRLSESLAGRVRFVDLWPLSEGEIEGTTTDGIADLFAGVEAMRAPTSPIGRADAIERVCRGGFPEAVLAGGARDRREFHLDYIRTITQRDVLELSNLHQATELPRLAEILAARTAQELVATSIANDAQMGRDTIRRYLPLLETVYVHHLLPAWGTNLRDRSVRRPKLHFVDCGLAAAILGQDVASLLRPGAPALGALLETFVVGEVAKQATWSDVDVRLSHWRDRTGTEVDLVLEGPGGTVVGVEVKATMSPTHDDAKGLRALRDGLGERFVQGVVVHLGPGVVPFGDRITAVPISRLWRSPAGGR